MTQPPVNPERIADETARRLLERAAMLDADGPTLAQLRQAAVEAGISATAFDVAVSEWRGQPAHPAPPPAGRSILEQPLRNAAALAVGWASVAVLAVSQALIAAPWEVHKLTDPIGLAIGAIVGARLRARTATILLGGLAVSQGAEFLMDFLSGAPAIHGAQAHLGLMIAGVAGVAVGRGLWGRRSDSRSNDQGMAGECTSRPASSDTSASESVRAVHFVRELRLLPSRG